MAPWPQGWCFRHSVSRAGRSKVSGSARPNLLRLGLWPPSDPMKGSGPEGDPHCGVRLPSDQQPVGNSLDKRAHREPSMKGLDDDDQTHPPQICRMHAAAGRKVKQRSDQGKQDQQGD